MNYIIVKDEDGYIITTQEALEEYRKIGILPYDCKMKYKKYLLEYAKKQEKYKKIKIKTIFLY